jgi:hypothetical protein
MGIDRGKRLDKHLASGLIALPLEKVQLVADKRRLAQVVRVLRDTALGVGHAMVVAKRAATDWAAERNVGRGF